MFLLQPQLLAILAQLQHRGSLSRNKDSCSFLREEYDMMAFYCLIGWWTGDRQLVSFCPGAVSALGPVCLGLIGGVFSPFLHLPVMTANLYIMPVIGLVWKSLSSYVLRDL